MKNTSRTLFDLSIKKKKIASTPAVCSDEMGHIRIVDLCTRIHVSDYNMLQDIMEPVYVAG